MPCRVEEDYEIAARVSKEYQELAQIACALADMVASDDENFCDLVRDSKNEYSDQIIKWVLEHRADDRARCRLEREEQERRRKSTEKRERALLKTLKKKFGEQ